MLPIAAHTITIEIEKKDARKHQCGPKGYCTITDFTERLPSPAQTKGYIQALKDRYRRASNPRKLKQTRRKEKLGKR